MFEGKDYARCGTRFEVPWSVTASLILINVAVFLLQNVFDYLQVFPLYPHFALSAKGLRHGELWQLITFQFLHSPVDHGGIFHLLGNMFVIFVFGRAVEQAIGKSSFLKLFLLSGVAGGLFQVAGGFFWPARFGTAVVGASAGACGLIAAFAMLFPQRPLHIFFIPIEFRARTLLLLLFLVSAAGIIMPARGTGIAHCAHFGGLLTGFILLRQLCRGTSALLITGPNEQTPLRINPVLD